MSYLLGYLGILPSTDSSLRKLIDLQVHAIAIAQVGGISVVLGNQVPRAVAATTPRRSRRACDPSPAVSIQIDEAAAVVSPKARGEAARRDGRRVCLRVANVPERVQVHQLTTGDLHVHRGRAAGRDHRGDVAGGAVWIDLVWAVALRRTANDPVLSGGSNWLSVDGGELRV